MSNIDAFLTSRNARLKNERGIKEIEIPSTSEVILCKPSMKASELEHIAQLREQGRFLTSCSFVVVYCALDERGKKLLPKSKASTIADDWGPETVSKLAGLMSAHVGQDEDDTAIQTVEDAEGNSEAIQDSSNGSGLPTEETAQ